MARHQYRVSFDDRAGTALERVASFTGKPVGQIVRQWMAEAAPGIEAVARALELTRRLEGEAQAEFKAGLVEASDHILQVETGMTDLFRWVEEYAERPPACNTGATDGEGAES